MTLPAYSTCHRGPDMAFELYIDLQASVEELEG
jgi:hypothetical protein